MGASGGSGGGGVSSGGTAYAGGNVLAMVGSVNNAAITGGTAGGARGPAAGMAQANLPQSVAKGVPAAAATLPRRRPGGAGGDDGR